MGNKILDALEGFDAARMLALINRVGGREAVDAILRGDKVVRLEDAIKRFFDQHGRYILPEGFAAEHVDPNYQFCWEQPAEFNYRSLVERMALFFPDGTKLPSPAAMESGCKRLEEQLAADPQVANLVAAKKDPRRGIRLPWCLPQMTIDPKNPGKAIAEIFVPAIGQAYEGDAQFQGRTFVNWREGQLDGQVTVVEGSQLRLIAALRKGPVYGWIFPAALQGIGIVGDRELMKNLPEKHGFVLGGFDSLAAMMLHTAVLAQSSNNPAMDLAAFCWQSPGCSLYLDPGVSELKFGRGDLGPDERYSGALSVFGQ